jgi:hypothetical protein
MANAAVATVATYPLTLEHSASQAADKGRGSILNRRQHKPHSLGSIADRL